MADIARETGLTLGTVSRALNTEGKYAIAPETRERVLQVATRLGYRPNRIGRALASGSAALVLLISPDPFAPYYVEVSRHLSEQASRLGYSFVSGGTLSEKGGGGIPANDWFYGVDGIVVCDYLPHQEAYIVEALRLKIPVVGLGVRHPFPTDFVKVDLETASRGLMRHLFEGGCVRPAMMRGSGTDMSDPRVLAYSEAVQGAGISPRFIVVDDQSRASGRKAVHDAFDGRGEKIDGLFCENDILAVGALRGLTDLGLRVPEDVRLAGCDGMDDALFQSTPITTMVQPLQNMCAAAWAMLQARIEGSSEPPREVEFVSELQVRASTSI